MSLAVKSHLKISLVRRVYGAIVLTVGSLLFLAFNTPYLEELFEPAYSSSIETLRLVIFLSLGVGSLFSSAFLSDATGGQAPWRTYYTAAFGGAATVAAMAVGLGAYLSISKALALESPSQAGDLLILLILPLFVFLTPFGWYFLGLGAIAAIVAQWIWLRIVQRALTSPP